MINPILPWQQHNWELLGSYINQQRIPQALLITGRKGLGKYQLATQFAQSLLCTARLENGLFCGHCSSCVLFTAGTHPDFMLVSPEEDKKIIGIDAIRQLITKLTLKPQFESHRVVLINPADQLNNAAANGFLKCLEEPNERTCIVLLTEKPAKLPATIRSRCQKLAVSIPSQPQAKVWLSSQKVTENIDVLLSLAQGAPLLAKEYAHEAMIKTRLDCFNDWLKVAKGEQNPILLAEVWHKQDATRLLLWQMSWITDMIKSRYSQEVGLFYHADLKNSLQELGLKLNLTKVYKFYDLLLRSQAKIETQINKQLMFEEILIHWEKLNNGS
jgi:DNA polymerase III subunit delta'